MTDAVILKLVLTGEPVQEFEASVGIKPLRLDFQYGHRTLWFLCPSRPTGEKTVKRRILKELTGVQCGPIVALGNVDYIGTLQHYDGSFVEHFFLEKE